MNELRIYPENGNQAIEAVAGRAAITVRLEAAGVIFERWPDSRELDRDAGQDEVIEAYREEVDRLMDDHGLEALDVVRISPDHPRRDALRCKFIREHFHHGMEIRCFVEGRALFYMRRQGRVYSICCESGDVIGIPAGMAHWVDVGECPGFTAIRLFSRDASQAEACFTGSDIAERFPRLEQANRRLARA